MIPATILQAWCMCVFIHVCVFICVAQHVHMGRSEDTSSVLSRVPSIFCLRQGLPLTWLSSGRPVWLASPSQESACLPPALLPWDSRRGPLCPASYVSCGTLNSGPHACGANTFPSELSARPAHLVVLSDSVTTDKAKAWVTVPRNLLVSICLQQCCLDRHGTVAGNLLSTYQILGSSQHQKDKRWKL